MENDLGLSDWAAGASERRSAQLAAFALLVVAVVLTPTRAAQLPAAFPVFAMILAASIMGMAITAFLLLFQARALRSMPTVVLASGYLFAAATMVPYAVLYPGMFAPLPPLVHASPAANGLLWFSWHAALLTSIVAFHWLRRADRNDPVMQRRARALVVAYAMLYLPWTAAAIWLPGMPTTFEAGHWTPLYLTVMVPIVVALALTIVVETARRRHGATVLDLWLGVAAFAVAVEVYLTVAGASRFTVAWYASRIIGLVATTAVLAMLLRQAAHMYARLVTRAEVLASEAHTDILTGLPNRRRFDEEFARAFGSAARRAGPLSLAVVDIDRFKLYNDAFGHQRGDEALREIAAAIADSVERSGDFAARYGGEEFVVILEDTTLEGAVSVAERIRSAVLDAAIRAPSGGLLSVSVGVATRTPDERADDLLRRADEALYLAKNGGRNRVAPWGATGDVAISG